MSFAVLARALFVRAPRERAQVPLTARNKASAVAIGLVLGLVLGLTSVGSGALIGPALILLFRLTPRRVVGTDVFHAAIMLWAAVPAAVLRPALGCALLGSALGVLRKAGLDLSAWEILGIPAAVGAVAWLVHRLQFRKAPVAAWARTS